MNLHYHLILTDVFLLEATYFFVSFFLPPSEALLLPSPSVVLVEGEMRSTSLPKVVMVTLRLVLLLLGGPLTSSGLALSSGSLLFLDPLALFVDVPTAIAFLACSALFLNDDFDIS